MTTIFVSDLHLSKSALEKIELFESFLDSLDCSLEGLYILGDLFDFWLGDDDDDVTHQKIVAAIKRATMRGIVVYIMQGNRDFLFREKFRKETGAILLPDYQLIELGEQRVLLTHGDLLCSDDKKYQAFRRIVRNAFLQYLFLKIPLRYRRLMVRKTRRKMKDSVNKKPNNIMDVNHHTVSTLVRDYKADILIHGHTHKPGCHFTDDGSISFTRIVLKDWYDEIEILLRDGPSYTPIPLERYLNEKSETS